MIWKTDVSKSFAEEEKLFARGGRKGRGKRTGCTPMVCSLC
jgi:hypothetical protein